MHTRHYLTLVVLLGLVLIPGFSSSAAGAPARGPAASAFTWQQEPETGLLTPPMAIDTDASA